MNGTGGLSRSVGEYVRRHHLGLVAIFIALSGTAVALPGKNTVDSGDIKAGQVKKSDLANNSVTSPKVADGSLQSQDFAPGQLPAGPQGPAGPAGSPDTGADILGKLAPVDGTGSGLDADQLDGLGANAFVGAGQSDSVTSGMIVNPTRAISMPLLSFYNCELGAGQFLDFSSVMDTQPDFVDGGDGGPLLIRWDHDAGFSDQTRKVCSTITVPPDFAANGVVRIRARNVTAAAGAAETIACNGAIDGAVPAIGVHNPGQDLSSSTSSVSCASPAFAGLAPDQALTIAIEARASGGSMDQAVDVAGVEFVYTAAQ